MYVLIHQWFSVILTAVMTNATMYVQKKKKITVFLLKIRRK